MNPWAALEQEVALWQTAGLRLPLWWRDDDAVRPTQQLDRLTRAAEIAGLPVHLAVIPALATEELAEYVTEHAAHLTPVVHGWAHENHASPPQKRSEFGTTRAHAAQEAGAGLGRLTDLFGAQLQPIFVPPWNRIHPTLLPLLPGLGYRVVSTFGPRQRPFAAPGLLQINTHLDPVDWRGTRGLADTEALLTTLQIHLSNRRLGAADTSEPYGLLTHHLIHDEDVWRFCARVLTALSPIAEPIHHITSPTGRTDHEPS